MHIVTIDGVSMEPLLSSGDRIVVDTTYERDAEEVNIVGRVIWAATKRL